MSQASPNNEMQKQPSRTFSSSQRMMAAASKYREAMRSEKSRNQLIEDYLPLVKSLVSRMRSHFPDHYEMEDIYGVAVKALVI